LSEAQKDSIVAALVAQGLANPTNAATITGGVRAGIFPPVLNDGSACPKLPQAFFSAPGSASIVGHHSYPGGLVVHESNNDVADVNFADEYRQIYGHAAQKVFRPLNAKTRAAFLLPKATVTVTSLSTRISSSARLSGMTGQSRSVSNGMQTAPNSSN
jgi:hypothetical protein